jgi:hypothetical protein
VGRSAALAAELSAIPSAKMPIRTFMCPPFELAQPLGF